jgi:hypothetical protein
MFIRVEYVYVYKNYFGMLSTLINIEHNCQTKFCREFMDDILSKNPTNENLYESFFGPKNGHLSDDGRRVEGRPLLQLGQALDFGAERGPGVDLKNHFRP